MVVRGRNQTVPFYKIVSSLSSTMYMILLYGIYVPVCYICCVRNHLFFCYSQFRYFWVLFYPFLLLFYSTFHIHFLFALLHFPPAFTRFSLLKKPSYVQVAMISKHRNILNQNFTILSIGQHSVWRIDGEEHGVYPSHCADREGF